VVVELAPFLDVEFVHQADEFRVLEAIVAEELANAGPILLFDMGVVILVIGATVGEGHGPPLPAGKMLKERPVEKLAAVVRVEAFQDEGLLAFQFLEVIADGLAVLVPEGVVLRPVVLGNHKLESTNR
jgi:hypothetical protein